MNTADYLLEVGPERRDALVSGQSTYTYGDIRSAVAAVAASLLAQGVGPSDRVGIIGANSLFWIASYLAVLKLGAVAVPLPVTTSAAELRARQDFIRCKSFCVSRQVYPRLRQGFSGGEQLLFEDSLTKEPSATWSRLPSGDVSTGQDAVLLFTSGTTARPKVVRLTHRNLQANTDSIVDYLSLNASDRVMAILPFSYCFGCSLLHTHFRVGGSLVLSRFLYPESLLEHIEATSCTGIAGVPSIYQTLLRNTTFTSRELPSLRKLQQAGGKLPDALIAELVAAVPHAEVFVMYGQTEATSRLSYLPPGMLDKKLGSIGRGIPGVTLQVVDEHGNPVAPGQVGEVVASGDNISPGYLDAPDETRIKFVDGALRTGDLARVDDDGFIYIVDRQADFIKSYGHRVSSQEIESAVLELKDVVAVAAIGVPDTVRGEAICLYVTLRSGAVSTPDDILYFCKRRLPAHAVPRDVEVLKQLPLNESGKVLKSALRQQAHDKLRASDPASEAS
jgi:acyl-CoA synthetase (AMP-forming)/AMP-acid ligase II